jgi:hypothetical protein
MLTLLVSGFPSHGFRIEPMQCLAHLRAHQRYAAEAAEVAISGNERPTHLRGWVSRMIALLSGKDRRETVYLTRLNGIASAKPQRIEPVTDD